MSQAARAKEGNDFVWILGLLGVVTLIFWVMFASLNYHKEMNAEERWHERKLFQEYMWAQESREAAERSGNGVAIQEAQKLEKQAHDAWYYAAK